MENNQEKIKWWKENKGIFVSIGGLFITVTIGGVYFVGSNPTGWLAENFFILVLFWFLLLAFILYLLVGRHVSYYIAPQYNPKARIAILLPLSCPSGYENDDLELMIEGFGKGIRDFAKRKHRKLSETYEIVLIDNATYYTALDKVKEELKYGTKYFICTTSDKSVRLSNELQNLNENAVLITTVSGSDSIKVKKDKVYNYYPTSKYEIAELVKSAKADKRDKPFIYCFDSIFTEECRDLFIEKWNYNLGEDDEICEENHSFLFSNDSDIDFNHSSFFNNTVKNADSIFIFGYGRSFYDILKTLKDNYCDITKKSIYTISTFKYQYWKGMEEELMADLDITTIRPCLKENEDFSIQQDVVEYFAEQTLERLLNTLELLNTKHWMSFDKGWKKAKNKQRKLQFISEDVIKVKAVRI